MKKQQLEIVLSKLKPSPSPNLKFEAYDLNSEAAVEILLLAEGKYHDLFHKKILDMGCGAGILAIGAALLGSKEIVGIDINKGSVLKARDNAIEAGVSIQFVIGDIGSLKGSFHTTIMNPPFGTRIRGADISFLKKAIEVSLVVYSLHKGGSNREFLVKHIQAMEARVDAIYEMKIKIPRTYRFHSKKVYEVDVDLFRIVVDASI